MIERDAIEFRKARANELRRLAAVLEKRELIRDPAPLRSAASLCVKRILSKSGEEFWGYDFDSLEFQKVDDESFRHSRPENSQLSFLELGVTLRGPCLDDNAPDNPFSSLSGDIVATGLTADGNRILSAWHLDKHVGNKGGPEPALAHPEYHFQHGGKNIRLLEDYGLHQILESPRIAHPPLDAILLVDFILSNYCGSEWKKLRLEDSTYKELVGSAQERYWAPYALATSAVSKTITATSPWKAKEIWPQLLIDRLVLESSAEA